VPLRPLSKKRATDEVYDSLRAAILSRIFVPGERLIADELSAQLGVSLTPIRHALQQLAVEGLVEIYPRSGTYVANVFAEDLAETFEIRIALEMLAAQRAVEKVREEDLERMKFILRRLALPVEDIVAHESANLEFHLLLFQVADSRRLREMYESLNAHIQIARIHAQEDPARERLRVRFIQEQKEHQAIFDALAARSLSRLQDDLRRHISRAQASLIEALVLRSNGDGGGEGTANKSAKDEKSQRM